MSADPILAAFDGLVAAGRDAALVATPSRAATRGEVDEASRAVAGSLQRSGIPTGGYALVACVNGAGFLAALVGARRAGCVPVLADSTTPPAERARIAHALGISVEVSCDVAFPRGSGAFRVARLGAGPADPRAGAGYVKLTSGSTGAPSGVAIAPEALEADDEQLASSMGLVASDRFVAAIPWSHSYGLSSLVLPALRRGSLLILPGDGGPWSPLEAARALGATVFPTVPIYLQTIASLAETPAWPASLRTVISAGAPLRPETAARFLDVFGRDVHAFYGASESGGICYDREGGAARRGTVGTPIDGVAIRLPDPDAGGEGTVQVRSAAAGLGHVPEANDRLRDGVFSSADLAAWTPRGELQLFGRADTVINAGGKKVQPAEVEAVLRTMPGVRDAAVVGVASAGGDREVIRAVLVGDEAATTHAAVTAWCRARLAAHKVPRSVVVVDEIPRTQRGKLDRAALAGLEPARARE